MPGAGHSPITPGHPTSGGCVTPEPLSNSSPGRNSAREPLLCPACGPAVSTLPGEDNIAARIEEDLDPAYASRSCLAQPVCRFDSRTHDAWRRHMVHLMAAWLPQEPPHMLASTIMFADSVRALIPSSSRRTWLAAVGVAYKFHGCAVDDHTELTQRQLAVDPELCGRPRRTWWPRYRKDIAREEVQLVPRVCNILAKPDAAVSGQRWSQEVLSVASRSGGVAWPAQRCPTGGRSRAMLAVAVGALIETTCVEFPELAYSPWATPAALALGALALAMNMFGPPPPAGVTYLRCLFRHAGSPCAAEALAELLRMRWQSALRGNVWFLRVGDIPGLPSTWQLMPPVTIAWQPGLSGLQWPIPHAVRTCVLTRGRAGPWAVRASTVCVEQPAVLRTWAPRRLSVAVHPGSDVPHGLSVTIAAHDPKRIDLGIAAIFDRLPRDEFERALRFWRAFHGKQYRVGTIFSGTDIVVCFLETTFELLRKRHGICVELVHEMSVESDAAKQQFIARMSPGVRALFSDAKELTGHYAVDVRTGEKKAVPRFLDHIIAGWVCKGHSVENMQRRRFATCLRSGAGKSGETYKWLTEYIGVHKPKRLLLENVAGILYRSRAKHGGWHHAQIRTVIADIVKLGFAVGHARTSSHFFLQPLRRNRVYIAGERLDGGTGEFDGQSFARLLGSMERPERYPLDKFLDPDMPRSRLTGPQLERLTRKLDAQPGLRSCDAIVDVAKTFTDSAVDMLTCPRPSSAPYSLQRERVVRGVERMRLQGLWEDRCPALHDLASTPRGDKFLADLAGNAFTLHVVGAAFIAQTVHSAILPEHPEQHLRALTMRSALLLQAIVEGVKQVENRNCSLQPGWYLLHLSKNTSDSYAAPPAGAMLAVNPWPQSQAREMRGKVVGCCLLGAGRAYATQEVAERALGAWANVAAGRYQHEIYCAGLLSHHHAANGQLGPWKVPMSVQHAVWQDDSFSALRAKWSATAPMRQAVTVSDGRPEVLREAGLDQVSATGAAPCGRASAGWAGRAGCPDPACLTCWPCSSQDGGPSPRHQGRARAAGPRAAADGAGRKGSKRAARCSRLQQVADAAAPCANAAGKRARKRAGQRAARCSGLVAAADGAVPRADIDGKKPKQKKRTARCSGLDRGSHDAAPRAGKRVRKQAVEGPSRNSGPAEAAETVVPRFDVAGKGRKEKTRTARSKGLDDAADGAAACADAGGKRMRMQSGGRAPRGSGRDEADPSDTRPYISYRLPNPKAPGSAAHARYNKYCVASTIAEAQALGALPKDVQHDRQKGYLQMGRRLLRRLSRKQPA